MNQSELLKRIYTHIELNGDSDAFNDALAVLSAYKQVDKTDELKWAYKFKHLARERLACGELTPKDAEVIGRAYEKMLLLDAQDDFDSYLIYMELDRDPKKRFYQPRRHVLKPIVKDLQDLADDKLDFLSVSLPPRIGKLLAHDTPVLTDKGFVSHGDLQVGDRVAAPDGRFVKVLAASAEHECEYKLTFTNGEVIHCHGEHEWVVYNRHKQREDILTVNKMIEDGFESGGSGRGHRHYFMLPNRNPLEGVKQTLHVPPYTLGAWLGDGTNKKPVISSDPRDIEVARGIVEEGYRVSSHHVHKDTGVESFHFEGLRADLKKYDMCFRSERCIKHIPEEYLIAPLEDRLKLLAGLLDTDGTLRRKENRYDFSTTEEQLKDDVVSLVSTFGWRVSVRAHEPVLSSSGIQGRKRVYCVAFNPTFEIPCRLERKQLKTFSKQRRIAIANIEPATGRKGKCIQVEGGVYLAGKTLLPTHNSTLCIFFLTWIMGKYPDKANVMSGHSDKLTKSFHMEALSIINDSSTYRFNEVFPDAPFVDSSNADETIHLGAKRRFPTLTCRSIDGTLTGAVEVGKGALLYCDDLVSDREEALNKDRMDKLYSAYLNQLKDRMLDGAKQLFVGTRWVPNDPIGRIEAVYADNPRYRFSTLPALNAQGESNFDYHYNLGFSTQYYQDMKRTLQDNHEEDSWSAKYMCEPYWREGLMFEPEELNYYESLPEGDPDAILAVCDTKGRGSDYCVQPIVYVYGDRHYVVSVVCDNSAPEYVESKLIEDLCEHKVSMARYESNLAGGRVAKDVQKACLDRGHVIDIQTKFSTANKETRILTDSPWIKSKCFFKREGNGDYNQFMKMLTSYTLVGKNKHDDAPDAMSMYKRFVESAVHSKVEVMKRPF